MTKIYFAGPLFSQADLRYNAYLVEQIRQLDKTIDLYLPQENAAINDKSAYADSKMIALADTENVLASDLLVALLDGPTIDAGVASEIGVAYAKGIPVVALYTVGLIKLNGRVVSSEEDLLEEIKQRLS